MRNDLSTRMLVLFASGASILFFIFIFFSAKDDWHLAPLTAGKAIHSAKSQSEHNAISSTYGDPGYLPFEQKTPHAMHLNSKVRAMLGKTKVVARVFYGRRAVVEILEVYLRRNLRKNGGILDRVEFAWQQGSTEPEDVEYLDHLVDVEPDYVSLKGSIRGLAGFSARYDNIKDGTIYVKIDDDMVYVDDNTFSSLVLSLLENAEYKVVSANVVRHPMMTHIHARKGAIYPFEFLQDEGIQNTGHWRPSLQPSGNASAQAEKYHETQIPVERYSYLPIRDRRSLVGTPLASVEYGPRDCSWASPYCSVHAHMSFFKSKEDDTLVKYDFGTWDLHMLNADRYSVNMIAWRGRYIFEGLKNGIIPADDEQWIAVAQVRLTGNHHIAVGAALASHLAYGQPVGFATPDYDIIIAKYKSLAQETSKSMREWTTNTWHAKTP